MPAMRRDGFQSLAFRLADPASFDEAKRVLEADKRVTVDVYRECAFYAKQSELLGRILRILAIMITGIMAVGAVFGAVNTMYAAVASRAPEIAVLLTLGFRPRSILASFLAESAVIAAIGRRGRLPARAADERDRDQHHQLGQLQRDRVQLPDHAGAAAGGARLRRGDGNAGRLLSGAAGEQGAGGAGDPVAAASGGAGVWSGVAPPAFGGCPAPGRRSNRYARVVRSVCCGGC